MTIWFAIALYVLGLPMAWHIWSRIGARDRHAEAILTLAWPIIVAIILIVALIVASAAAFARAGRRA